MQTGKNIIVIIAIIGFIFCAVLQSKRKYTQTRSQWKSGQYKDSEVIWENDYNDDSTSSESRAYLTHYREWFDYNVSQYKDKIQISEQNFNESRNKRVLNHIYEYHNNLDFWYKVYSDMVIHDSERMPRLIEMFNKINNEQQLSYKQFAQMVVACIQHIPYVLVVEQSCGHPKAKKLIKKYKCPCIGNIKYGVQSPAEFMYNLKGDCDTRSVLLYAILTKFGYDVVILTSEQYTHAILGINIPSSGLYKKHRGKKYYIWETTVKDSQIGYIHPSCSNMSYWNIALTNGIL